MSPDELSQSKRLDLASLYLKKPWMAHEVIFKEDHGNASAPFHEDMVKSFHSAEENEIFLCFRGSAKSSRAEEAIAILAASGQLHNCVIVGDSFQRALDRLTTIRRHLKSNPWIKYLYGDKAGEIEGAKWQESKIELQSQSLVWALGQGQAVLGTKHVIWRPDYILIDDLENMETAATEDARAKLSDWYWGELLPAMAPPGQRRVRVTGTPWHPEALAVKLSKHPSYKSTVIPIEYIDKEGRRISSWPSRFPLDIIDELKNSFVSAGKARVYAMQYMVEAVDPDLQLFKQEHLKFEPRVRTWEPVYVAYDPARTDKQTSDTTGIVAASLVGRKMIIWEARGPRILPDQIVEDIFRMEEKYEPIAIGVEVNGLNQFITQPLRHEQLKRGKIIPIRELKAPKGKPEFIKGLHPLMAAGDIVFAGGQENFKEAIDQILAYPVGHDDILNAMAYIPSLRGGTPVYDTGARHVSEGVLRPMGSYTLAINAGAYGTTALLFQYAADILLIHRDWISEGSPGQTVASYVQEARLETGKNSLVVIPPFHFDTRNSFGLLASLRGVSEARKGGDPIKGREFIRELLRGEVRGCPRLLLAPGATWSRRAMTGGYVWEPGKTDPRPGLYATLMAGLEAAIAPAAYAHLLGSEQRVAFSPSGQRYNTAEPSWQRG